MGNSALTQVSPDSSVIRNLPIQQRIDWLMEHARRYAQVYQSPESFLARERYSAKHDTAIIALKCMDGRLNLSVATNTPSGIIQPIRNIGGRFDMGWPHFGEVMTEQVQHMVRHGRRTLVLINYHYSKGDQHRGCAGWGYNTDASRDHALRTKRQVEEVFGSAHSTVYPLVCGFETDEDALILHGSNHRDILDLSTVSTQDLASLPASLSRLYPDMPEEMQEDLLPLVQGNIAHIEEIRKSDRTLEIVHHEWMIGIGRGFHWLHMPNLALIIGPYSPELADPLSKAGGIIAANMRDDRIPDDGFLLLSVAPYQEVGVDRARATLKSRFMADFAAHIIRSDHAKIADKINIRKAVLSWHTRALELIV
ncbi:MAG: hypothetical protein JSR29_06355 [Nitrospira sp.]|nr:hypothetical protein [Nitrospira sp.]